MRVLLSEASSLTAREHLSVLGPTGIDIDVASCSSLAIGRFSRWCHHVVRVPRSADDPKGYLTAVADLGRYKVFDWRLTSVRSLPLQWLWPNGASWELLMQGRHARDSACRQRPFAIAEYVRRAGRNRLRSARRYARA